MSTCLNWNLPQVRKDFEELKSVFQDENVAYALLSRNKGNNLDITPNGKVCMMMTRWHHDDVLGRIIARANKFADYIKKWEKS
jgi:hypothetical protein